MEATGKVRFGAEKSAQRDSGALERLPSVESSIHVKACDSTAGSCSRYSSCVQTLGMAIVTLSFALLGFLSPAHRSRLLQSAFLLFTFMGAVAGYFAAKVSKIWVQRSKE